MPRRGRLHIPGACYHVIGRGLERRYIFEDSEDKRDFLARFGNNLLLTGSQCLAWAIMSNHYHLLVRAGAQPLAKLMAPVLGGFAGNYNRRHRRSGYVFQNRFASILCDEESYLLELVRYIHLNPMRARLIDNLPELCKYPWTGHAGIMGKHRQKSHCGEEVLAHFGTTWRSARMSYIDFMQAGLAATNGIGLSGGGLVRSYGGWETIGRLRQEHISCIGDERILGNSSFIEQVLQEDELAIESRSRLALEGWDLNKLLAVVCERCEVAQSDLLQRSREDSASRAKAMICYLGTVKLGLLSKEIAKKLAISRPAVSKWISKGREIGQEDDWIDIFD
jgi:putative transposase